MGYKLNMKKLALVALILLLIPTAFATKGVGISWTQESAIFPEGKESCLTYGVYNPFDENVEITLTTEGLEDLNPSSETKFVKAGTSHSNAEKINICFDIPRGCGDTLEGEIVARESPSSIRGVTGSATVAMASVPLTIKISCDSPQINPIYIILIVAAIMIGSAVYFSKKK
jgi:hypothetical protein